MTKLNCKPGDLAFVVTAHNPENIGAILRVIRAHRDQNAMVDFKGQHIWLAEAPRFMTYSVGGKLVKRIRGVVPDAILLPIRGFPWADEIRTTKSVEDKVAA